MKVTLANGKVIDNVVNVEEMFNPRSAERGTVLSVRMTTEDSVETLRGLFTPEATASITIEDGEKSETISGYTVLDSIRKFWDDRSGTEYNAAVDLLVGE